MKMLAITDLSVDTAILTIPNRKMSDEYDAHEELKVVLMNPF